MEKPEVKSVILKDSSLAMSAWLTNGQTDAGPSCKKSGVGGLAGGPKEG